MMLRKVLTQENVELSRCHVESELLHAVELSCEELVVSHQLYTSSLEFPRLGLLLSQRQSTLLDQSLLFFRGERTRQEVRLQLAHYLAENGLQVTNRILEDPDAFI